jgi:hypothetical protein
MKRALLSACLVVMLSCASGNPANIDYRKSTTIVSHLSKCSEILKGVILTAGTTQSQEKGKADLNSK